MGVIGLGRLGAALARGLARADFPDVTIFNRTEERAAALASEHPGLRRAGSAAEVFERCDPVFCWTDPEDAEALASEHATVLRRREPLVVTCQTGWRPDAHTPRWAVTLPNVNLACGAGSTLVTWGPGLTDADRDAVRAPLLACGEVHEVDPEHLGPLAALTSSGPALYARALEAWADTLAARHGLDRDLCRALVRRTVAGTLALQALDDIDADEVVRRVAHPGGTTAQGLAALDAGLPAVVEAMLRGMGKWDVP